MATKAKRPAPPEPRPRPYFLPSDLDFAALPDEVRAAYEAIVEPAYSSLVLQVTEPVERAAGATFVHLLFLELLDQFDLGRQVAGRLTSSAELMGPREADLNRHLRLVANGRQAAAFLMRLRKLREKDPFRGTGPGLAADPGHELRTSWEGGR